MKVRQELLFKDPIQTISNCIILEFCTLVLYSFFSNHVAQKCFFFVMITTEIKLYEMNV